MSRRSDLITGAKQLSISQAAQAEAASGSNLTLDNHEALAYALNDQLEINKKLKSLVQRIGGDAVAAADIAFMTKHNNEKEAAVDALLQTARSKRPLDVNLSEKFVPNAADRSEEPVNGKACRLFTYKGEPPNLTECLTWLDRIATACKQRNKTIWFQTLERYADGNLLGTLRIWKSEGHTDPDIITPWIEKLFGGILRPAEATRQLASLDRKGNESLNSMSVRISELALMATRGDPVESRTFNKENLSKGTLLRITPAQYKNDFLERENARVFRGENPYSYRETVLELAQIWVKYEELNKGKGVHALGEETVESSEDEIEPENAEDQASVYYVNHRSGHRSGHRRVYRPNYKNNFRFKNAGRRRGHVRAVEEEEYEDELPVLEIDDENLLHYDDDSIYYVRTNDGRRGRVYANDLNVEPNACFKCGRQGHKMFGPGSETCPFKNEPLKSKCPICKCGGHRPEICLSKN